jgi:hypothetical protein
MSSLSVPPFSRQNHPAGEIAVITRRDVGARVNALAGYRMDLLPGRSAVSRVEASAVSYVTVS